MSVLYTRIPRLFADLAITHGDARYARLLRSPARVKLPILDDWGPEALTPNQALDLLEIVGDRYDKGSLIITSQVPVDRRHDLIGIPTLADAILDRVIHNACVLADDSAHAEKLGKNFVAAQRRDMRAALVPGKHRQHRRAQRIALLGRVRARVMQRAIRHKSIEQARRLQKVDEKRQRPKRPKAASRSYSTCAGPVKLSTKTRRGGP